MALPRQERGDADTLLAGLEKEFESTFGELIPGIIHDFASPLNGIMGRCELMERRVKRALERIAAGEHTAGADLLEDCQKIYADAALLSKEANRLFDLFNKVSDKFRTMRDITALGINLSELVEAEVRFLRFYPEIKHTIDYTLHLDPEVPEITGIRADYSMALSTIIRHAIDSMRDSELKKLIITTGYDDSYVFIRVEDTGVPGDAIREDGSGGRSSECPGESQGLTAAVSLLEQYGVLFEQTYEAGMHMTSVRVPHERASRPGDVSFGTGRPSPRVG